MSETRLDSQRLWDWHASENPLWAILSDPSKTDRHWDVSRFFQTGVREIEALQYELRSRRIDVGRAAALDFGCGVGRLTQALAPHFARVVGVDISPKMIDMAASLNRFPDRVRYVANPSPDFTPIGDARFDFILTRLTLQHIEPDVSVRYIAALCDRLAAGGVLVMQVAANPQLPPDPPLASVVRLMPDDAYRAAIAFQGIRDGTLTPGGRITLDLRVENLSMHAWSQRTFGRMTIGNHWLDATGQMLLRDDGRTGIPESVAPGDACLVPLSLTLPGEPGEYWCEIDLAHEGLLWFEDRGSATERVRVTVGRDDVVVTAPSDVASPRTFGSMQERVNREDERRVPLASTAEGQAEPFPMYGVSKETVLQVIAGRRAEVVDIQDDHSCGDDWVSYQYYVRAPGVSKSEI